MTAYTGSCHCGAIGFQFRTAIAPAQWSIRACQCAFCRAHAALSCSDPAGRLVFAEHEPGALVRYRFGLKTADFLLCSRCGVYVGAVIDTPEGRFGIFNTRALSDPPPGLPDAKPMVYDGDAARVIECRVRRELLTRAPAEPGRPSHLAAREDRGIDARVNGAGIDLLIVTDADDAARAALLIESRLDATPSR